LIICTTKAGSNLLDLFGGGSKQRRRLEEETGGDPECHQSIWQNPDPDSETTAEKAVAAWYEQGIYFDYETGLPTPGKEKEAYEFLNVINTETTKVGFAVKENIVMGYYCPRANTDPEALKRNTPRERVAPTPPEAPEGVDLVNGAPCPA